MVSRCISEGLGGEVVQCAVRSVGGVFGAPVLGENLGFEQTTEGFGGQEFVAKAPVEGFANARFPTVRRIR